MLQAVCNNPVVVSIFTNQAFQAYTGGIFSQTRAQCGGANGVNHAVLVVGYGTDAATGTPYWVLMVGSQRTECQWQFADCHACLLACNFAWQTWLG